MEKIKITPIIAALQKKLVDKPFDLAHDITHHARVYKLTRQIIKAEDLTVNESLLSVAAWSHDAFGREGNQPAVLSRFLRMNNCPEDFIRQIVGLVMEHSFGNEQSVIESRVLYDADKLEYVSSDRLNGFLLASKKGLIDAKTTQRYKKQWYERVYQIPDLLHFPWSKKEFARLLPEAEKIMAVKYKT